MVEIIQGKYERAKKHYEASKHKDYFEFEFPYVDLQSSFREIDRFLWESRHEKTRFKNRYAGDVLIDITDWNNRQLSLYFDAFMYFLKDNEDYKCTFMVRDCCSAALKERLEEFFELSFVDLLGGVKTEIRTIGFVSGEKEATNV